MLSLRTCLIVCLAACGPTAPITTATDGSSGGNTGDSAGAMSTSTTTSPTTTGPTTGAPGTSGDTTSAFMVPPDMGATFIMPIDGGSCGGPAPNGGALRCKQCDTWANDCPNGEKCSPYSADGDDVWDSHKCALLDPDPDHAGEPCTVEVSGVSGIDSCDIESMCWHVDEDTLTGVCVPFCDGIPEDPICPPGTDCLIAFDGALNVCLPTCGPLVQDCPAGDVCVPSGLDGFVCTPDASGEGGQLFAPCESFDACDPGLACAGSELASECDPMVWGCCLPFCDTTAPDCPGAMQQCLPWFEMGQAPPGLENLGLCQLPQ